MNGPFADCTSVGPCPAPGVCQQTIGQCGETWRKNRPDTRIVYGARCSWWDAIAEAGRTPSGLPGCPHCGGVLMEVEDMGMWEADVNRHALTTGDLDYPNFVGWLRGKCYPSVDIARNIYLFEMSGRAG